MTTTPLDNQSAVRNPSPLARMAACIVAALALLLPAQELARLSSRAGLEKHARFASAGTHNLRLLCSGQGDTTYVLEAGATGFAETWTWVQSELDDTARICSYDRAGMGLSERSPHGFQTGNTARELHAALADSGEHGPYILVGHSLGGFFVRDFAAQFPDDTAAIVLVDASHEKQLQAFSTEMVDQFRAFPSLLSGLSIASYSGILHIWNPLAAGASGLEGEALKRAYMFAGDRAHLATSAEELRHWNEITARALDETLPASLPVLVVTAGSAVPGSQDFSDLIEPLHREFAGRFSAGKQVTIEDANHFSVLMNKHHARILARQIAEYMSSL